VPLLNILSVSNFYNWLFITGCFPPFYCAPNTAFQVGIWSRIGHTWWLCPRHIDVVLIDDWWRPKRPLSACVAVFTMTVRAFSLYSPTCHSRCCHWQRSVRSVPLIIKHSVEWESLQVTLRSSLTARYELMIVNAIESENGKEDLRDRLRYEAVC
jgi:hypothetical protein